MKFVKLIDHGIEKVCEKLLVISLLSILFFSSGSIMLRWVHINFMWIDPLVRHLVFLCTFLGGVIATGKGTHIGIDLVSKIIEMKGLKKLHLYVTRIITLSSALSMIWLFDSGIQFAKVEFQFAKSEFFGISSGVLVSIIPLGVALIGLRFFAMFIETFDKNFKPNNVHTGQGQAL